MTGDLAPQEIAPQRPFPLFRNVSLWVLPTVIVAITMGVLAAMYLGGSLNPAGNLSQFPIAIVNQDTGATLPDGSAINTGDTVASSLVAGIDPQQFDVRQLSLDEATSQMDNGTLYGAIVIPTGFSTDLLNYAASTTTTTLAEKPVISVLTNLRASSSVPSIVTSLSTPALDQVNSNIGQQLLQSTQAQLAATGQTDLLTGAAQSALTNPIAITVEQHNPLPAGTGNGLSAFYFALLLSLCGFTGSLVVSSMVDSSLGFIPTEMGPKYTLGRFSGLSRLATLTVKWVIMLAVAIIVAALYVAIGAALGMPIANPIGLWAYSVFAIWAVAVVAQTLIAILGPGLGLLANMFVFVVLSLPTAGATIPPEATPGIFRWLGSFEPMHQIYLGTRSILYFNGTPGSGLAIALVACAIGAILGIVGGVLATRFYDLRGHHRGPMSPAPAGSESSVRESSDEPAIDPSDQAEPRLA